MKSGVLRYLVHIQAPNAARDPAGQLVLKANEPWKRLHRKQPAGLIEVSGGEGPRGMKVEATIDAIVQMRMIRGVDATMRVELCDGVDENGKDRFRYFNIVRVMDPDSKGRDMDIHCTEVK